MLNSQSLDLPLPLKSVAGFFRVGFVSVCFTFLLPNTEGFAAGQVTLYGGAGALANESITGIGSVNGTSGSAQTQVPVVTSSEVSWSLTSSFEIHYGDQLSYLGWVSTAVEGNGGATVTASGYPGLQMPTGSGGVIQGSWTSSYYNPNALGTIYADCAVSPVYEAHQYYDSQVHTLIDFSLIDLVTIYGSSWVADSNGAMDNFTNWDQAYSSPGYLFGSNMQLTFGGAITAPRTISTDSWTVTDGTVTFNNSNKYTIAGPGQLVMDGVAGDALVNVVNGSHEIAAPLVLKTSSDIIVCNPGDTLTLSGSIGGAGGLSKSGPGTLCLIGANTFAGPMVLSDGLLCIGGPSATGVGALVFSGGTVDNSSAGPMTLSGSNPQNWNGNFTFLGR